MKILKIVAITLIVNCVLLPFYGLDTIGTVEDMLYIMVVGVKQMLIPTIYIIAVYVLIMNLSKNWFQKTVGRLVLIIVILICITVLSQIAWSTLISRGSLEYILGFWGFYFLWTLLACIMIPVLDRFYSKRTEQASSE